MSKFCSNCGNTLEDNMKFCKNCGTPTQETNNMNTNSYNGYQQNSYQYQPNYYSGYPQNSGNSNEIFKKIFLSESGNIVSTICKISAIAIFVLASLVCLIVAIDAEEIMIFLTAFFSSFIFGLQLYVFGEIIDRINEIAKAIKKEDTEKPISSHYSQSVQSPMPTIEKRMESDWVCKKCGTPNDKNSMMCKDCGTYR